jgi:hypothetical protein
MTEDYEEIRQYRELVCSGQAKVILDMLADAFRMNELLMFSDYESSAAVKEISKIVEKTGRTVWNGT